ncbi:MAG: class I SAM-dependent methyltransferase [Cypionkella sp.]
MSRLDSVLRRLNAQRDGLNWAAEETASLEGDALEVGLGNGRTYDHLREVLPNRRIWVIDRALHCHPDCIPPAATYLEGEAGPMLTRLAEMGVRLALAHYDLGSGVNEVDVAESVALGPLIGRIMAPGGLIVSGQPMVGFKTVAGPASIPTDRYFIYSI